MTAEHSVWNPKAGYDEWRLAESNLRAFYKHGAAFASEGYRHRWDRLANQPSDGEGPDLFNLMDREVEGLLPSNFDRLLGNLCVPDAVTLYEVYLERRWKIHGRQVGVPHVGVRSPNWPQLEAACRVVGIEPRPEEVKVVIAMRDLLTHRRGELSTDAQRERYDTTAYGLPDFWIELPAERVEAVMSALRSVVESADRVAFPFAWGATVDDETRKRLV